MMTTRQELIELAQADAKVTLDDNMLAHFYCDVPADDPGPAQRYKLDRHLGRDFTGTEWDIYNDAYCAALGRAVRVIEAKLDPDEDEDAIDHHNEVRALAEEALLATDVAKPVSQTANRRQLTIIVAPIKGVQSFHFTSTALQGDDLWFPVGDGSLFTAVERAMVANEIAHNVVSVHPLRECGPSTDYLVRFNIGRKCPTGPGVLSP